MAPPKVRVTVTEPDGTLKNDTLLNPSDVPAWVPAQLESSERVTVTHDDGSTTVWAREGTW